MTASTKTTTKARKAARTMKYTVRELDIEQLKQELRINR